MRARTLAILAVAAVAALVVAMLAERTPGVDAPLTGELLLPGLEGQVNEVTAIRIEDGGQEPAVTLSRDAESWGVAQAGGYAADTSQIRKLLIGLARAAIIEPKTANPEYYPRLGLAEPGSEEGAGLRLVLEGVETPAVIVGNRETTTRAGTYVRVEGRPGSFLVDAVLDPPAEPDPWLDKALLDVPAEDIESISVSHADGGGLTIRRQDGQLALADLPADREPTGPAAAQAMSRALSGLRFEEVRPASSFEGGEPAATAVFRLEDGRVIRIDAWQAGEERWIALGIEPGSGDAGAGARQTRRHEGWVYRIPTYKYDLIARRLEDMTREKTPAAAD